MKKTSWLISKYLLGAIVPYFAFSWLLLSVILFVQQAGRYSDIFFSVNIPANLVWQLTVALIPNVIAFTCPMAMLVGTVIGLTKMQGDSELVAIRAAGVGNLQIAFPIMLLGILLSIFAFFVNLKGVPLAAALVRSVALQTAIKKLESPIEPGVFNSEVAGYTIYVKDGDFETGRWKNIFIYHEDRSAEQVRLITSQNGRIDMSGQVSELVLENAVGSTLPLTLASGKYVSENIGEVRLAIRTKRSELIEKLGSSEISPDELGLQQATAETQNPQERLESNIVWNRRIILSISPFLFAILGTVIVLRFNRGGRGFGILAALVVLISFYMLAFLGEQLGRIGLLSVTAGSLIPIFGSLLAIVGLALSRRIDVRGVNLDRFSSAFKAVRSAPDRLQPFNIFVDLTTGLRDFDLLRNLIKNFLLTLCFLSAIFLIFTAFELWKFAGTADGGVFLLAKYLFFLLPFIYLQIAPSAAMIGTLATYVIKSRQNEIVTWTSAGQSVYRLLLPCFLLMALIGGLNLLLQERILPGANRMQDETRMLIRNQGTPNNLSGKFWTATSNRIYSFDLRNDQAGGVTQARLVKRAAEYASDNEKPRPICSAGCVSNLSIYEFGGDGRKLQTVYRSEYAVWNKDRVLLFGRVEKSELSEGNIKTFQLEQTEVAEKLNPLAGPRKKPNHLNSSELRQTIANAGSELEQRNLQVSLERKYTTLFLPFVMALFTAPFSLSLSRKGKAATVGYAVGLWLLFTGTSTIFEQFGLNGMLTPRMAIWSPLVIFSLIGIYLISKVRT
jgi:lipopolysaccharide export LptBFGC system permease protein LptF